MKTMLFATMLTPWLLLPLAAQSHQPEPSGPSDRSFIQTNAWWNLYFSRGNDPLQRGNSSINAVKLLEVDEGRSSWVKIAFPRSREEHSSIFGPVAQAHHNDAIGMNDALSEWEKNVSEWRVMWVNLGFVVHMAKVEPESAGNGSQPIHSETNHTSSATAVEEHSNPYLTISDNDVEHCFVVWFTSGESFSPQTPDDLIDKLNGFLVREVSVDQIVFKRREKRISAWILVTDILQKNEIKTVLKKQPELSPPQVEKLDDQFYDVFKQQKSGNQ